MHGLWVLAGHSLDQLGLQLCELILHDDHLLLCKQKLLQPNLIPSLGCHDLHVSVGVHVSCVACVCMHNQTHMHESLHSYACAFVHVSVHVCAPHL